jgi:ATP-dependent Lon protease
MENQVKLSEEELASVQELRESIRRNVEAAGKLHIRKYFIEDELKSIHEELSKVYLESMELDSMEKVKIDEILEKYEVPYVIVDQTELLVTEPQALSEEFMFKLEKYLSENITVDDVLDRIGEVGLSNITVFEKYYIDRHKDDE